MKLSGAEMEKGYKQLSLMANIHEIAIMMYKAAPSKTSKGDEFTKRHEYEFLKGMV